jgi:hypothetical protein
VDVRRDQSAFSARPDGTSALPTPGVQTLARTVASPPTDLAFHEASRLLVVTSRLHPHLLERRLRTLGVDPARVTVVPVLPSAVDYDGPMTVTARAHPGDLTGVGVRFLEALETVDHGDLLVVDALGPLSMYVPDHRLAQFVAALTDRARAAGLRGVFTLPPDVGHPGAVVACFDDVR